MYLLKEDHSNEVFNVISEFDDILIQASPLYKASASTGVERQRDVLVEAGDQLSSAIVEHTFSSPKSASKVESVLNSAIPKKTMQNTEWAEKTWFLWATQRLKNLSTEEIQSGHKLEVTMISMRVPALNYWLGRFIFEVRTMSGKEYSPFSVYQLCCELQRSLRNADCGDINIFKDSKVTSLSFEVC